LSNLRF